MKKYLVILFFIFFSESLVHAGGKSALKNFIFFEDRTEAVKYYNDYELNFFSLEEDREPQAILDSNDTSYNDIQLKLDLTWKSLKKLFPTETQGFSSPQIVIISDLDYPTAHVIHPVKYTNHKYPFLVVVTTGLLEQDITDANQIGTLAHELGHTIFRNSHPDILPQLEKIFHITPIEEQSDSLFTKENDPELTSVFKEWKSYTGHIGELNIKELNGLPSFLNETAFSYQFFKKIITSFLSSSDEECDQVHRMHSHFFDFLTDRHSSFTLSLEFNSKEKKLLNSFTQDYVQTLKKCITTVNDPFHSMLQIFNEVYPQSYGFPIDQLERYFLNSQDPYIIGLKNHYSTSNSFIESYLNSNLLFRQRMKEIETNNNFKNLRWYNFEDHSDEIATQVLLDLNLDPLDYGTSLLTAYSEEDYDYCLIILKRGEIPFFGGFEDPHHTSCYRYFRIDRYMNYLNKK